jgi:hypothetical protein
MHVSAIQSTAENHKIHEGRSRSIVPEPAISCVYESRLCVRVLPNPPERYT